MPSEDHVSDKQSEASDSSSEQSVRSMLEYLFLDVKVRSPEEVRPFLRNGGTYR